MYAISFFSSFFQRCSSLFWFFVCLLLLLLFNPGPHDINSDGLAVKCQSDRMDVTLSRLEYPWLDPSLLHLKLINSDCSAYNVTDSQVEIQIPLSRCGTRTRVKNKFVLESRNVVIIKAKRPPGVKVTYLPQIHFRIFCAYEMDRSRNEITLKGIGKWRILTISIFKEND